VHRNLPNEKKKSRINGNGFSFLSICGPVVSLRTTKPIRADPQKHEVPYLGQTLNCRNNRRIWVELEPAAKRRKSVVPRLVGRLRQTGFWIGERIGT
jgi:hypothetical protein